VIRRGGVMGLRRAGKGNAWKGSYAKYQTKICCKFLTKTIDNLLELWYKNMSEKYLGILDIIWRKT
jgi:hypothetical protein